MVIQIPLNAFKLTTTSTDTKRTTTAYFTVPDHTGINSASLSYVTLDAYGGNTQDAALYLDSTVRAHDNSWLAPGGKDLLKSIFTAGQHSYRFHLKSSSAASNTWELGTIVLTLDYTPPVSNPGTITLNKSSMQAGDTVGISLSAADAGVSRSIRAYWGATLIANIAVGAGSGAADYAYVFPLADCSRMPNSASGTLTILMESSLGITADKTMTILVPDTVVPTIESVTATKITNGVNAAIDGYVQGYSGAEIRINEAAGALGSTISAYKITGGGFDRSTATEQLTPLPDSGDIIITGEITDSRGRKASKTVTVTVLPYTSVSANGVAAYRSDANQDAADEGLFATLKANLIFSSLNGQNAGAVKGRVYEKGTAAPAYTTMANNAPVLFGGSLSVEKAYIVNIEVSDLLTSYVYTIEIPTGSVIMGIAADGDGVSFGVYPEAGKLKSAWPISAPNYYPVGAIYMSEDPTSPAVLFGGTWSAIAAGRFLVAAGTGYDPGSTGGSESIQLGLSAGYAKIGYLVANYIHLKTKTVPSGDAYETYINATTYRNSSNVGGNGTELGGTTDVGDNRPPYYAIYIWRRTA